MKWLDDVLASVPEDFKIDDQDLPPDAATIGTLPEELVPVVRAWTYTLEKIHEVKETGLKKTEGVIDDLIDGKEVDRDAVNQQLIATVRDLERLERQEKALRTLLSAALWDQFAGPEDESIGVAWNAGLWVVFSAPDDRPEASMTALLFV